MSAVVTTHSERISKAVAHPVHAGIGLKNEREALHLQERVFAGPQVKQMRLQPYQIVVIVAGEVGDFEMHKRSGGAAPPTDGTCDRPVRASLRTCREGTRSWPRPGKTPAGLAL